MKDCTEFRKYIECAFFLGYGPFMSVDLQAMARYSVGVLNDSKQSIKYYADLTKFVLGVLPLVTPFQLYIYSVSLNKCFPLAPQTSDTLEIRCVKISLFIGACLSFPGTRIISSLVGRFSSPARMNDLFGPNTIFAENPRHPRHVMSLLAVLLSLPAFYQFGMRSYRRFVPGKREVKPLNEPEKRAAMADDYFRKCLLLTLLISRPAFHWGNRIARAVVS